MKRPFLLILIASLCYINLCYGQRFTTSLERIMNILPRTADDFQSKYYDTDLESVYSVNSLTFPFFEGIPIMKHSGSISSMTFQIINSIERFGERQLDDTPKYSFKMAFSPNGVLTYENGARPFFFPNVPCSTHVGDGIDLSLDNDMTVEYTRDAQNKVIEAVVLDDDAPFLIFRYSYLANSKKISTIKGYNSNGKLIGEVAYSYDNGRISELYFKGYSINNNGSRLETEYKKRYTYDGHGNYSKVDMSNWRGIRSTGFQDIYTFDNQYDSKGRITVSKVGYSHISNSGSRRGGTPSYHTKRFTYDSHGNWIKVERDDGQVAIRKFEYK